MKTSKDRYSLICLMLCFFSVLCAPADAAYQLPYFTVGSRIYGDGTKINRLSFEIFDEQGNRILGTNGEFLDLDSVVLIDPNQKHVSLSEVKFIPDYQWVGGNFDYQSGAWNYNSPTVINEFQADILEPLMIGTYTLNVTCDDNETYSKITAINQFVDLPVVSSNSFVMHPDTDGNVYFSWEIPPGLVELSQTVDINYRPYVWVYSGEELEAILWPTAPVHISMLYIPASVVQWLESTGSDYRVGVVINASGSINRRYSKSLIVNDLLTTVSKKKQVVVVPMF